MEKTNSKSFEEKFDRVAEIANSLEGKNVPLEELMKTYEEGIALIKELEDEIKTAEQKIEIVKEN